MHVLGRRVYPSLTVPHRHACARPADAPPLTVPHRHVAPCRMRAMQAELDLLRGQMDGQQLKLDQAAEEAEAALSRRELLSQTIEPLRQELEKLQVLMMGVAEGR